MLENELLFVVAMDTEVHESMRENTNILFTGVGTINATMALTRYLATHPEVTTVVNIGTAGSINYPQGAIVSCNRFFQRDMNCSPLGYSIGETPYDDNEIVFSPTIQNTNLFNGINIISDAICSTGNSFENDRTRLTSVVDVDVVDMEAYALAIVSNSFNVGFNSIKMISDNVDSDGVMDWSEFLIIAQNLSLDIYNQVIENYNLA